MINDGISVIVPAHNEEKTITRCLESINLAAKQCPMPVEIVVVVNRCTDGTEAIARRYTSAIVVENARNLAKIRNVGIQASRGGIVATIDADSWMSKNMLLEVYRRLASEKYVGGGVHIVPERMSMGIFFSIMTFAPKLVLDRCWAGMFWMRRQSFEAIGGFNDALASAEDVDFARRLRAFGKSKGLRYGLIMNAHIVTSCRKFDQFGDWYLFRNRQLVYRLLSGRDQDAADHFYYNVRQNKPSRSNRRDGKDIR